MFSLLKYCATYHTKPVYSRERKLRRKVRLFSWL